MDLDQLPEKNHRHRGVTDKEGRPANARSALLFLLNLEFVGEMTEEGTGNREQEVLLPRFLMKPLGFQSGSDYSCSLFPDPCSLPSLPYKSLFISEAGGPRSEIDHFFHRLYKSLQPRLIPGGEAI